MGLKIVGGKRMKENLLLLVEPDKKVPRIEGLPWEFSDKAVTAWGGLRLMKEMLDRIGMKGVLAASGMPQPGSNRGYDPVTMMESFWVCVWAGGVRFSHTAMVRFDEALREIFGWKRVGSVATFTRFFRRFGRETVDGVFGHLNRWFWEQVAPKTITVDLDSSVMTRYGEQEGATVGYNPEKRGRRSHHPLFAFVADLRMVLHAWMRPGNTGTSNGADVFFAEALEILGAKHKVGLVRADSGFFVGKFLDYLEGKVVRYIVAVRLNRVIRREMAGVTNWVRVDDGIEVSEFAYRAGGWEKDRRVIVVRQNVKERAEAKGKWLLEVPGYRYQSYVTDLELPPVEVWRLYRGRADSENRIGELKYDFGMSGFCLDSFYGTEAAFRSVLMAYNLMSVFRQALLQAPQAVRLSTMRFQCFAIGALLGRRGRNKVLRLSLPMERRPWFEGLFARIETLQSPWPLPT